MKFRTISIALVAALVGATGFALGRNDVAGAATSATRSAPPLESLGEDETDETLPQDNPAAAATPADGVEPSALPAALTWKAPASWPSAPNPSSMRLATYKVPRAAGDREDGELSVARAGGELEANVQRWVDQFDGASGPRRREKTVRGLKVAIVEVEGTYQGGMGSASAPHAGWALLGAIVLSRGEPYFFKLTGPAATVRAAHAELEALLDSVTPVTP